MTRRLGLALLIFSRQSLQRCTKATRPNKPSAVPRTRSVGRGSVIISSAFADAPHNTGDARIFVVQGGPFVAPSDAHLTVRAIERCSPQKAYGHTRFVDACWQA